MLILAHNEARSLLTKRGGIIKPATLTLFWNRRICEVIAVFGLLIIGLYIWVATTGIGSDSEFYVSPLAVGISIGAIALAAVSYFAVPESFRSTTTYAAYLVLLFAVGTLILTTGTSNSPFVATWMIVAMFAGIFGRSTLAFLFLGINAYFGYVVFDGQATEKFFLGAVLAGELPIIVSYILWHGKSSNESTKERAYYNLANELDQISNKSDVVIGAINDGVIAVNNQGQIELINPAAQRIIGWGHQDALNLDYKSVLQLLTADGSEVDKSSDPVFEVLTTNQPVRRNNLLLQTNSGKKVNIEIVVSPIGHIGSGAIIVFRDVTKEQAEEKVQAEFISTASHEMRTPVASIEGYLGLVLNPGTATIDDKAREYVTKAHEAAQHLGRLFQDLLDITKADDGRLSNNPKVIDVVAFTNDIVEGLRAKADEKNLRLFFKPIPRSDGGGMRNVEPVFYVDLDADHLREVLSNLVENAIKYTPEGEVVIDVQADETHIVISVTDSGIGIPAEDIPHLFQKFYRVDNTDTREIGGTGLGLYLCRRLVEAMGGRIWVDSEYKKGSTFSVELPRIPYEEAQRLIEASSKESIKPSVTSRYLDGDTEAKKLRADALATPIILNKSTPAGESAQRPTQTKEVISTAQPTDKTVDPLIGDGESTATPAERLRPINGMVLPPAIQNMPSNLQKARAPAPMATEPFPAANQQIPSAAPHQSATAPQTVPTITTAGRTIAVPERK